MTRGSLPLLPKTPGFFVLCFLLGARGWISGGAKEPSSSSDTAGFTMDTSFTLRKRVSPFQHMGANVNLSQGLSDKTAPKCQQLTPKCHTPAVSDRHARGFALEVPDL